MEHAEYKGCNICAEADQFHSQDRGIYVTGLPPGVTECSLKEFFGQYGRIDEFFFPTSGLFCIVKFFQRSSCDVLLKYEVFMHGRRLIIKPKSKPINKKETISSKLPSWESVCAALCQKPSFQDQLQQLVSLLEPEKDISAKYKLVCRDLTETLCHICPSYEIIPFGSTVSGLAFKGSDLDVFFGKTVNDDNPVANVFARAKRAISKRDMFRNVVPIAHAKVPIIKFVHKSTGIQCDLSFLNILGVQNSKLIKFLSSVDERVRPLFIVIKYWAKLHNLTGQQFSNYALILLIVSFLQNLDDPILPPIFELQPVFLKPIRVNAWNANFDDDITRLRPISNCQPLDRLLWQFFDCLSNSNFHDYVLCPVVGQTLHKSQFDRPECLPLGVAPFVKHFLSSTGPMKLDPPLCIQDPIELSRNVSQNLSYTAFGFMRDHCSVAARICMAPQHLILPQLFAFDGRTQNVMACASPESLPQKFVELKLALDIPHDNTTKDKSVFERSSLLNQIRIIFEEVLCFEVTCESQKLFCQCKQILWASRDYLWEKLHSEVQPQDIGSTRNPDDDNYSHDHDVQVIFTSLSKHKDIADIKSLNTKKRKLDVEKKTGDQSKKFRFDKDSTNHANVSTLSRSLKEEMKLTQGMVKTGHAPQARWCILQFECFLMNKKSSIEIHIIDQGSKLNYFESLCDFLRDKLPHWITLT